MSTHHAATSSTSLSSSTLSGQDTMQSTQQQQHQSLNASERPSKVLIMTVTNVRIPVTIEHVQKIFQSFGEVRKVILFTKNDQFKCLVELPDIECAKQALALEGKHIFEGCNQLSLTYSARDEIQIRYNGSKSWDFTSSLTQLSGSGAAGSTSASSSSSSSSSGSGSSGAKQQPPILNSRGAASSTPGSSAPSAAHSNYPQQQQQQHNIGLMNAQAHYSNTTNSNRTHGHHHMNMNMQQQHSHHHHQHHHHQHRDNITSHNASLAANNTNININTTSSTTGGGGVVGHMSGAANQAAMSSAPRVILAHNLPTDWDCDAVFTLFCVYGDVERVKIHYKRRDTAFIEYSNPVQASMAINMLSRLKLQGKELILSGAKALSVALPVTNPSAAGGLSGVDRNASNLTKDYTNSKVHRFKDRYTRSRNIFPPSNVIHVSNLPPNCTEADLSALVVAALNLTSCKATPGQLELKAAVTAAAALNPAVLASSTTSSSSSASNQSADAAFSTSTPPSTSPSTSPATQTVHLNVPTPSAAVLAAAAAAAAAAGLTLAPAVESKTSAVEGSDDSSSTSSSSVHRRVFTAADVTVAFFQRDRKMAYVVTPTVEDATMLLVRMHNYRYRNVYLRLSYSMKDADTVVQAAALAALTPPQQQQQQQQVMTTAPGSASTSAMTTLAPPSTGSSSSSTNANGTGDDGHDNAGGNNASADAVASTSTAAFSSSSKPEAGGASPKDQNE